MSEFRFLIPLCVIGVTLFAAGYALAVAVALAVIVAGFLLAGLFRLSSWTVVRRQELQELQRLRTVDAERQVLLSRLIADLRRTRTTAEIVDVIRPGEWAGQR